LIGLAFQIKDDLFDYTEDSIGKPTGIDIKEQKMTLPLIYVLNNCEDKDKKWIINIIKNHHKDPKKVKELIQFVIKNKGLEYAITKMNEYKKVALELLKTFPNNKYRSSLELMLDYVIDRKK